MASCKIALTAQFCLFIKLSIFAQQVPLVLKKAGTEEKFLSVYETNIYPSTRYAINLPVAATSIALKIEAWQVFDGAYILSQNDTLYVTEDTHAGEEGNPAQSNSNLAILRSAQTKIIFYSGAVSGKVTFYLLNSGKTSVKYKQGASNQLTQDCAKPFTIDQDVWRAGLPSPVQSPEATQPKHLIVHHAATSNSLTDYTYVVRNIYLYHTQVNKWNDIGYNFLIAQDGTVFQGRDGRRLIEDDNVLGAHFCGKNTNTMGICLLGNYTSIPPTEKALASLTSLLSWKANKENVNPLGNAPHPQNNATASFLNVIAGHRDGCSTECPGDYTYALLPQIRQQVNIQLNKCKEKTSQEVVIYPQPGLEEVFIKVAQGKEIQQLGVYDITGKNILPDFKQINPREARINTHSFAAGMYVLRIYLQDKNFYTRKLLIIK